MDCSAALVLRQVLRGRHEPSVAMPEVSPMTTFRQSLLSSFEQCPRRAMHGMAIDDDITVGNVGSSADLGSAFHAVAAEILRTLHRQGEEQIPTQEAVEILYEVLRAGPWVLPT